MNQVILPTYHIKRHSSDNDMINNKYQFGCENIHLVFANGPGDRGSIPDRVVPRLKKFYLVPPYLTLSNVKYVSTVKWSNPRNGRTPSPTPWCSSYWKWSLLVAPDFSRQLYFTYIMISVNNNTHTLTHTHILPVKRIWPPSNISISYHISIIFNETSKEQQWFYLLY